MKIEKERFQEACSICLEGSLSGYRWRFFSKLGRWKTNDPNAVIGKDCRHIFHQACINPWLAENNSCPTCRIPFTSRNIQQLALARNVAQRIQQNAEVVPYEDIIDIPLDDIQNHLNTVKNELNNPETLTPEQLQRRKIQHYVLFLAFCDSILDP